MKPKKTKLMIVTPYFYPKQGGLENYAYNIAKGLKEKYNCQIIIITSNHKNKKQTTEKILGIKIYRLPYQFKLSNTPISFKWKKQIREIIKSEKPDIINAHSPVPFISDITAKVAKQENIPFTLTYHAGSMKKKNSIFNLPIFIYENFILNKTLKISKKIFPVSKYVKNCFPKKFHSKCIITPNFILNNKISLNKKQEKKENQLIFLGSLDKSHKWKGLYEIINAINIYVKSYDQDIKLIIAGEGNHKNNYKKLVKSLDLEKNIEFKGYKQGKEKNQLIQESKALIFYTNNKSDAFPTVFLEAWQNKTPIIASNIGPSPYLIKNNKTGILVKPNSPKDLAKAIYYLLNNKKLQNNITKQGNKLVKDFTLDNNLMILNQEMLK